MEFLFWTRQNLLDIGYKPRDCTHRLDWKSSNNYGVLGNVSHLLTMWQDILGTWKSTWRWLWPVLLESCVRSKNSWLNLRNSCTRQLYPGWLEACNVNTRRSNTCGKRQHRSRPLTVRRSSWNCSSRMCARNPRHGIDRGIRLDGVDFRARRGIRRWFRRVGDARHRLRRVRLRCRWSHMEGIWKLKELYMLNWLLTVLNRN